MAEAGQPFSKTSKLEPKRSYRTWMATFEISDMIGGEELAVTNDHAGPRKPLTLRHRMSRQSSQGSCPPMPQERCLRSRLRVKTPKLATPDAVVAALISLSQRLGQFARVSIGFPGVVRADFVMTAPNLGTKEWHGFRLGAVIAQELRNPVRNAQ